MSLKENLKEEVRNRFEDATGIIGQALKARREKIIKQKEVAKQVSEIKKQTAEIRSNDRAFKKIEADIISISKNLRMINQWAGAAVESQVDSDKTAAKIRKEAQAPEQVVEKINEGVKEDKKGFAGILDVLNKWKTKLPKMPKIGKGKLGLIVGGAAAIGVGAYAVSKTSEENSPPAEEKKTPPPLDYTPQPTVTSPPPPADAPTSVTPQAPAAQPQAAAPPAPVAAVEKPKVSAAPPPPKPVSPSVSPAGEPVPPAAPPTAQAAAPATGSVNLSSAVKLADPGVTIAGINPEFEKRVGAMATAFKQQTGKTLLVTSGVRSNEKQKELYDAKVAQLGGNTAAAGKLVAEPMAPLGQGRGSAHLKGLAIDINSKGDAGINTLAGTRDAPTGWLEKFGLTRPVPKEDWHVQLAGAPPVGDVGGVPGKDGNPIDPSTGKPLAIPTNPTTGQKLLDTSKTVDQLKRDNAQPGETVVVVRNTTNKIMYDKQKQPQPQTVGAVG